MNSYYEIDISVIIPIYNPQLDLLGKAIDSVLCQKVRKELILVNDGSTQNVVETFLNDRYSGQIVYLTQPNGGPASARNLGIKNAKGYYICFLDQDDMYCENGLQDKLDYMKSHPDIGGCLSLPSNYNNSLCCYKEWIVFDELKPGSSKILEIGEFCGIVRNHGYFFPDGFICKKQLFNKLGMLDVEAFGCDELEFYLRTIHFSELHFLQKSTFYRDTNNTSSSKTYYRKMWFGKLTMVQKHKEWILKLTSRKARHEFSLLHDMIVRKCVNLYCDEQNWKAASILFKSLINSLSTKNLIVRSKYYWMRYNSRAH